MDTLLIVGMYAAFILGDYIPKRKEREKNVNCIYVICVLASIGLLIAKGMFPEMPTINDVINGIFLNEKGL